jgi:hypothetical protein
VCAFCRFIPVSLPDGRCSTGLVASFFHGERITFAVLAVLVGIIAGWGALTLTDSRSTEERPDDGGALVNSGKVAHDSGHEHCESGRS